VTVTNLSVTLTRGRRSQWAPPRVIGAQDFLNRLIHTAFVTVV
jgi:hypothetical protein